VQLYLHDVTDSVSQPVKQLRNFEKITLQPGEEKVVSFALSEEDLKFYNQAMKFGAEPGEFEVMIGLDSETLKKASFNLL